MTDEMRQRDEILRQQREQIERQRAQEQNAFKRQLAEAIASASEVVNDPARQEALRVQQELDARKAEAEHVRLWRARLKALNVVEWEKAWDPTRSTNALERMRDWERGEYGDKHLMFVGPCGVGKTCAALHWCKGLVEPGKFAGKHSGRPVVWLRPDDLVSAVCHQYDANSPRLAPHIVLEELGEEKREDFLHALHKLLDKSGYKILALSSLTRSAFKARYSVDKAVWQRLNHFFQVFYLSGESLRSNDGGF